MSSAGCVAGVLLLATLSQGVGCRDEVVVLRASNRGPLRDAAQDAALSEDAGRVEGGAALSGDASQVLAPQPVLLYRFDEGAGRRVFDSSADGALVHLTIENPGRVTWLQDALRIDAPTRIINESPPLAATGILLEEGATSVEAWITPSERALAGPHTIVGIGVTGSGRDLLVEQGSESGDASAEFLLRVRTYRSEPFALSTGAGSAQTRLTHVVMVSRADQTGCAYVNGSRVGCSASTGGFANWEKRTILSLGNRPADDPDPTLGWTGELHWVAVYGQALTAREIEQLFLQGPVHPPQVQ